MSDWVKNEYKNFVDESCENVKIDEMIKAVFDFQEQENINIRKQCEKLIEIRRRKMLEYTNNVERCSVFSVEIADILKQILELFYDKRVRVYTKNDATYVRILDGLHGPILVSFDSKDGYCFLCFNHDFENQNIIIHKNDLMKEFPKINEFIESVVQYRLDNNLCDLEQFSSGKLDILFKNFINEKLDETNLSADKSEKKLIK